jgi:hypothetical protein
MKGLADDLMRIATPFPSLRRSARRLPRQARASDLHGLSGDTARTSNSPQAATSSNAEHE